MLHCGHKIWLYASWFDMFSDNLKLEKSSNALRIFSCTIKERSQSVCFLCSRR